MPVNQKRPMNGELRDRYASLSPLSVPSALKRLTLAAVTRVCPSYARMPKSDHPDGAEKLTQAAWSSLLVSYCRRLREYSEATNLNRQVVPGVDTT